MTRIDEAEQVFRRLTVENRAVLFGYFQMALEAENLINKPPDYGPENTEKKTDWRETPGANYG